MKPEFVTFKVTGDNGVAHEIPVNPNLVCMIIPSVIPGMIDGPNGEKMGKAAAALDFGIKVLPVECSVKEAVAKLEGRTKQLPQNPPQQH